MPTVGRFCIKFVSTCVCVWMIGWQAAHTAICKQERRDTWVHTACLEEMGAAAAARRVKHWENLHTHTEKCSRGSVPVPPQCRLSLPFFDVSPSCSSDVSRMTTTAVQATGPPSCDCAVSEISRNSLPRKYIRRAPAGYCSAAPAALPEAENSISNRCARALQKS